MRILAAINEALFLLRRLPIAYIDLVVPVDREEAFQLSRAGVQLTFDNLLRLQAILQEVADQLGDHPASIPVHGFWDGMDALNYEIIGESPFGRDDDQPADPA